MNTGIKTSLYDTHVKYKAYMGDFAGYILPMYYPDGTIKEHLNTRNSASIFDVSHMAQVSIIGDNVAEELEQITPSKFKDMKLNFSKYTVLLNDLGGIVDDCIISKKSNNEYIAVLNASCAEKDIVFIKSKMTSKIHRMDRSLIALQGPESIAIASEIFSNIPEKKFYITESEFEDINVSIYRVGYTGEEGFEISVDHNNAPLLWEALISKGAKPAGLAARNSLRLEAGYPLYGNELNEDIDPVSANLSWLLKNDQFNKYALIAENLKNNPKMIRIGITTTERRIPRTGDQVFSEQGENIGYITSGCFSPELSSAIAHAMVEYRYLDYKQNLIIYRDGREITNGKIHDICFM